MAIWSNWRIDQAFCLSAGYIELATDRQNQYKHHEVDRGCRHPCISFGAHFSTWWAIPSRQTVVFPTHTTAQWTLDFRKHTCGSFLSDLFPRAGPATSNGLTTHPASSAAGVISTNKMWRYGRVCLAQGGIWCLTLPLAMTVFGRSRQTASTEPSSRTMSTLLYSALALETTALRSMRLDDSAFITLSHYGPWRLHDFRRSCWECGLGRGCLQRAGNDQHRSDAWDRFTMYWAYADMYSSLWNWFAIDTDTWL